VKISNILLRDFVAKLKENKKQCTLLGVGPVSKVVITAAFLACKKYDCPPIFVASRNQVDLKSLGHGYLMGAMDQYKFVELINHLQKQVGYEGPLYICRDHGGPWQRNIELDEKYPVKKAMTIAKESFKADIEAGFNYIHIDPTKCPLPFKLDDICNWTVELIKYCEQTRKSLSKGAIDYEVGTEDIQGGLTTKDTFESFLKKLTQTLQAENLPQPTCVVAQTGTLLKIDRNVGRFDKEQTKQLAQTAAKYGLGLKEHNGDYLDAESCRLHPRLGVTAMNVAPEFGLVETEACLHLADIESKIVGRGRLKPQDASNLRELFINLTFTNSPWKKWLTEDLKKLPTSKIETDPEIRLLIARVCGHYVYDIPQVIEARKKLYNNINKFKLAENAETFVVEKVRDSIEFYMEHFLLKAVNAVLKE